jgi:adenylate cyclase
VGLNNGWKLGEVSLGSSSGGLTMGKEIERKYLVDNIPASFHASSQKLIFQTYLAMTDDGSVRVRRAESEGRPDKFSMTIKAGQGVERDEAEAEISKEIYDQMLVGKEHLIPLVKTRYTAIVLGVKLELDIFRNTEEVGLMIVEIEFPDRTAANAFNPLHWFGREVTHEPEYLNQNLWAGIQK